ncbi:hypothetical protein KC887_05165 [Candidatus Kaiserbacteria bacterium]|nr:hypothetical protein [Candidatus Kaiserbacteria bacterium]
MKVAHRNMLIQGASFAKGFAFGTPLSVSEALAERNHDTVLVIKRNDTLESIEAVCALCAPRAAILEGFSPYSHQHWLCSYYDVPAISLREEQILELPRTKIFLDLETGSISFGERDDDERSSVKPEVPKHFPLDGNRSNLPRKEIRVFAQINAPSDVGIAVSQGCDGFGEIKSSIVEHGLGKITITAAKIIEEIRKVDRNPDLIPVRFFDASPSHIGDHSVVDGTANSALGIRGVRLFGAEPSAIGLFLESLSDIRQNDFVVVLPMVNTISELKTAKFALSLPTARTGVQFETPMSCLSADELLSEAAFGIIGLNDLTQYTTAWDRNRYHEEFTPHSTLLPQVVALAKNVCLSAKHRGVTVAIAVDLYPTDQLAADIHEISPDAVVVSPRRIKQWKKILGVG